MDIYDGIQRRYGLCPYVRATVGERAEMFAWFIESRPFFFVVFDESFEAI